MQTCPHKALKGEKTTNAWFPPRMMEAPQVQVMKSFSPNAQWLSGWSSKQCLRPRVLNVNSKPWFHSFSCVSPTPPPPQVISKSLRLVLLSVKRFIERLTETVVAIQSLSRVQLPVTPWTTALQASLSFTLSQFAQTYVHWVNDAIQPSHPLFPPSFPALNLSQHQGLFQWVSSSN